MRTFKDRDGYDWTLDVNGFTLERVKAEFKVYLPSLLADRGQALMEFLDDDCRLIGVIFELCRERAEKDGRTLDDLKRTWAGEWADVAAGAFIEELIDFFRDPKRRKALRELMEQYTNLRNKVIEEAMAELNATDVTKAAKEIVAKLKSTSATELNGHSGSSAESSDSIPARSPSVVSP